MTWEFFISYKHAIHVGIAVFIFFAFLILRRLFSKYVIKILRIISRKAGNKLIPDVLHSFDKPLQWFFIILGIYFALVYYPYFDHQQPIVFKWFKAFLVILTSWGFVNLFSTKSNFFKLINDHTNVKLDDILIPFLSRVIQFTIIAIALSIVLQEFDYQIGGLITGLGLGGLAVSLAAKDALANLFGGIVIVTEKPFTIGDWILTPSVEGTVEDISFRSTKVRTFAQALVTVPNATLANEPITNWSKMGKRRITFRLPISYETPRETLEKIVRDIKAYLENHPDIHQETIFVTFDEFGQDGLEIFLYFFTKTTVWGEHLAVREKINLEILKIIEEHDAEIAVPIRKLYVESKPQRNE